MCVYMYVVSLIQYMYIQGSTDISFTCHNMRCDDTVKYSSSTPAQLKNVRFVVYAWLCQWQEYNVWVLHYHRKYNNLSIF